MMVIQRNSWPVIYVGENPVWQDSPVALDFGDPLRLRHNRIRDFHQISISHRMGFFDILSCFKEPTKKKKPPAPKRIRILTLVV